jgi:hypothetical protein
MFQFQFVISSSPHSLGLSKHPPILTVQYINRMFSTDYTCCLSFFLDSFFVKSSSFARTPFLSQANPRPRLENWVRIRVSPHGLPLAILCLVLLKPPLKFELCPIRPPQSLRSPHRVRHVSHSHSLLHGSGSAPVH